MKWVYSFGNGQADGDGSMKKTLGGKGAGLAEMTKLGLPVPPGFTIITDACNFWFKNGESYPGGIWQEVATALALVEERMGRRFGDARNPLLFSVRSGAPQSMPGMMDTVLNLGLNDDTVFGLAELSGNAVFAWDSYRRFITMFGDVVLGIHYTQFHKVIEEHAHGKEPRDMSVPELQALVEKLKAVVSGTAGAFPVDPQEQLKLSIEAVFRSFNSQRARYYRKTNGIPDDVGTAVNVQTMVFGNMGGRSATGVAFTRNPNTGRKVFFGEWLPNAQGEDVVAGTHTPQPINGDTADTLEKFLPSVYGELDAVQRKLESHYRDMQDIEFTIEEGRLFMLQTRTGKRTPAAAVQIVVDLVDEGLIAEEEALKRVKAAELEMVLRPVLDPAAVKKRIAKGLDASPGAASGRVVFHSEEAQELAEKGEHVLLVRLETSPEDIQGMTVARGILTARGGQTSHAAVVTRGMGKPCVVGCTDILVDYQRQLFYAGDHVVKKGDWITIDGGTGEVFEGRIPTLAPPTDAGAMGRLLSWADKRARLKVRANADTGPDAENARHLGAVGIGLCRTEHMFFEPTALRAIRQMILADDELSRQRALAQVLPIQRQDFVDIFRAMDGLPVTIRLLDPPLHEFVPSDDKEMSGLAHELGVGVEKLKERVRQLHEANPMMGHRGCRIGVTTPEVYNTQVRAIFEAAVQCAKEGKVVIPEVMIPLVSIPAELERCREQVEEAAGAVLAESGVSIDYRVGTMIELPRAAILADKIAAHADFFSFGTNDLTQMTYGFSRDDMGKFFGDYVQKGVLTQSPLAVFDSEGVGVLVEMAATRGRAAKKSIKLGVCGEHGGDPTGVKFFHKIGLDYVSCSPFRVPVARLAAAHAALEAEGR
ncbi:MAG: pyruvate, phosphate dikinase [Deltaproteobacteria bacterium]|nr:pyruvate, phosphate dikinase [Deltaproteobacteria bacterium]